MSEHESQPKHDGQAKSIGYHPLVRKVAAALVKNCRVMAGVKVIVAVSGGADSVALIHALHTLSKRRGRELQLAVGHVQHGLRPCAEDDAKFVEKLAARLGLAFFRADVNLGSPSTQSKNPGNMESRAREARYHALVEMAREFEARYIAVAHHADDQLETPLMRLTRGAGLAGLSGMAWQRPVFKGQREVLVRPMLGVDRAAVLDFLESLKQPYCTDPTNHDLTRARANLRANVLPALRQLHPNAAANAARSAEQIAAVNRLMTRQALALLGTTHTGLANLTAIHRQPLGNTNPTLLSHAIRLWLTAHGAAADNLGSQRLSTIMKAILDDQGGTRTFDLTHDKKLVMTWTTIQITSS